MLNAPFFPRGPLYLVTTAAVNCATTDGSAQAPTYRVKNISGGRAYLTWGSTNAITAAGAPVAGTPSAATIGMEAGSVESLSGLGPFFISSIANAFEVLPGEGL